MLPFHLVILGPQGSGKGTQTHLISKKFKMPYLSAGELIRKKALEKTEEGKKIKILHDAGSLISHKIIKGLIEKELKKIPQPQTVIFEGYPRTPEQIRDFEEILRKRKIKEKRVIILEIKEETVYKRLAGRKFCPSCEKNFYPPESLTFKKCPYCGTKIIKRPDDTKASLKRRLLTYKNETKPVISYLKKRGELIRINGEPQVNEVKKEITRKLERLALD